MSELANRLVEAAGKAVFDEVKKYPTPPSDRVPIRRGVARRLGLYLPFEHRLAGWLKYSALPPLTRWQEEMWSQIERAGALPPEVD